MKPQFKIRLSDRQAKSILNSLDLFHYKEHNAVLKSLATRMRTDTKEQYWAACKRAVAIVVSDMNRKFRKQFKTDVRAAAEQMYYRDPESYWAEDDGGEWVFVGQWLAADIEDMFNEETLPIWAAYWLEDMIDEWADDVGIDKNAREYSLN